MILVSLATHFAPIELNPQRNTQYFIKKIGYLRQTELIIDFLFGITFPNKLNPEFLMKWPKIPQFLSRLGNHNIETISIRVCSSLQSTKKKKTKNGDPRGEGKFASFPHPLCIL